MTATFKDIAAYIDPGHDHKHMYDALAVMAEESNCHVTGVYAIAPMPPATAEGPIPVSVIQQFDESSKMMAQEHRDDFETAMKQRGLNYSWECHRGVPEDVVAEHFRYADIGVVRQCDSKEPTNHRHVVNHALLNGGRPVLVIPYIGTKTTMGNKVILGWNSSVQSTRAVHDAIPLMKDAQWVHVIDIDNSKSVSNDTLGASVPITEHLSRHGIDAEATTYPKTEIEPGDVLINHAADHGADLIVAGAWGHTRAREYIFGGTTRTLLDHMTVPVLFSH